MEIFKLIFGIMILVILFRMLSAAFNNLLGSIRLAKRRTTRKIKEKILILEEQYVKEKWINNLRNGKPVIMGEAVIQCKNDVFIIDGHSFPIKRIQKLDITCEISSVLEELISRAIDKRPLRSNYEYEQDYGYRTSMWQDNFGQIISTQRMTLEEYHKKLESVFRNNEYGDEYFFNNYQFEFEKEYYILITFYNGIQQRCLIGREIDKNNTCIIPQAGKERFIEIEKCINDLK